MNTPEPAPSLIVPDQPLDPRIVRVWVVTAALVAFPFLAAGIAAVVVGITMGGVWGGVLGVAGGLVTAAAVTSAVLWPRKRYQLFRWTVRDEGVIIRDGWVWRRLIIVPHSRIQAVDTESGPLLRRYGLGRVHIRTASASGSPRIPGIAQVDAHELTRQVAARADAFDAT